MPSRSLSLAEQIAQLSNPAPEEFDPESAQDPYDSDRDGGSEEGSEVDENAGREHYVEVGKSKLRQNQDLHLHPKYNGATVSRDNLDGTEDEEDEDDEDDDEDEELEFGEESDASEEGGVKLSAPVLSTRQINGKGKVAVIQNDSDGDIDLEDMRSDDDMEDDDEDDEEMHDDDDDSDDDSMEDGDNEEAEKSRRDELRSLMAAEKKSVVANLSQAAKSDAEKGLAVRSQRAFFDECLKSRMQIKNALISVNSLASEALDSSDPSVQAAEDAAIALWNTISKIRYDLVKSREGKELKKTSLKRKHEDITRKTGIDEVWKTMSRMEMETAAYRNSTIEKWSSRVHATANVIPASKRLNQSAVAQTISSQLRDQLIDVSGEISKSRVPQESAPLQKTKKIEEDASIYDDTDFYKRLLLVLLEQRGNSATNGGVVQLAPADLQELKVKKHRANVDTKASKGRKLRYHVHEKLQNFMMPDDGLAWHEQQIDEFFSSLMGQRRRVLDEQSSDEGSEDEMVPVSQLFRNTVVS